MNQFFKLRSRTVLALLILGIAFQFAKAEFHFDGDAQGGLGVLNGGSPFTQQFIGYHFPEEPFTGCADYGKFTGFNANPNISGCPNPNGPVDEIKITAVVNAAFPNYLYTGIDGPITGISQNKWNGSPRPTWSQDAGYTSQEVIFRRTDSPTDPTNYTQELYFNIRFALNNTNRAFLYFDSYYQGVWKERYVIKWNGSWVIYPVNVCNPIPTPIAEWNFDECIQDPYLQNIAFDDIATIQYPPADGTILGAVRAPGVRGSSLKFYNNDYVEIGTPAKLDLVNTSMSISCWIYATSLGSQDMQIISKGYNGNTTQYELKTIKLADGHHLTFRCFQNSGGDAGSGVYTDTILKAGYWYHVVGTYQPTSGGNGTWKLFVNGNLQKSKVNPGPIHTNQSVLIGAVKNQTTSVVQYWWDGYIDEVKVYNIALSNSDVANIFQNESGSVSEGNECTQILSGVGNPILWYDGNDLDGDFTPNYSETPAVSSGSSLATWIDKTTVKENSSITGNRIPRYFNNIASGRPGVTFYTDYASNHYGYSDILVGLDNQGEYLTTQNKQEWSFNDQTDKNLIVLFKTGNRINASGDPQPLSPYYSDGRQTIAEFGGPLSGFNIYISQGQLCFGMWNRIERKYTKLIADGLYPLTREKLYLAHIEYNMNEKGFKVHFSDGVNTWVTYLNNKEWIDFSGLTRESENEMFAVGGASRTSYHDYNTGETYSDHFEGSIIQVLLYNEDISWDAQNIYNTFTTNYGGDYQYDYPGVNKSPKISQGEWVDLSQNETITYATQNVNVFPNPTENNSTLAININNDQNIRIELVDNLGNIVSTIYSGYVKSGLRTFNIDCSDLSTGFYTYRISCDGFVQTGKLIINK